MLSGIGTYKQRVYTNSNPNSTHDVSNSQEALVFAGRELEIQFRMSRPLADFMATLHKNGVEEKRLSKYVQQNVSDDIVTFYITFPEEGKECCETFARMFPRTVFKKICCHYQKLTLADVFMVCKRTRNFK